jgi:YesN/AraC family two-component response regulator
VLAPSADDALALLAVRHFDVLLTDIMMPGRMDGIGLAEEASALYPTMKILLMSGYSRETATNRADIPWALLVKPFGREDLDAALKKAFRVSGFAPQA